MSLIVNLTIKIIDYKGLEPIFKKHFIAALNIVYNFSFAFLL